MFVLDTNVVSEMMRSSPDARVRAWIDGRPADELHVTSVTVAEVWVGVMRMQGRRQRELASAAERVFAGLFLGRVLAFDSAAARLYAEVDASRRASGRPLSREDGQIASIARTLGMGVATRNVRDFEDTGIEVVNPWTAQP